MNLNNTVPQKEARVTDLNEELKELAVWCQQNDLDPRAYTSLKAFIKHKQERSDQNGRTI